MEASGSLVEAPQSILDSTPVHLNTTHLPEGCTATPHKSTSEYVNFLEKSSPEFSGEMKQFSSGENPLVREVGDIMVHPPQHSTEAGIGNVAMQQPQHGVSTSVPPLPTPLNNNSTTPANKNMDPVQHWSVKDIGNWLKSNGFSQHVTLLGEKSTLNGCALTKPQDVVLNGLPVINKPMGDNKCLLMYVHKLGNGIQPGQTQYVNQGNGGGGDQNLDSECVVSLEETGDNGQETQKLKPEYTKLIIAYLYMTMAFLVTSTAVGIAHDRYPDQKRYPPLPDIVLDNLPYVPWAFKLVEVAGMGLFGLCFTVLFFHKHRCILFRRMCTLFGAIFLLRSVTMVMTALSVPDKLKCQPKTPGDFWSEIGLALQIWTGAGLSLQGVKTCGDYMFSGHTVLLTLLNFFIIENTPKRFFLLHAFTWFINIAGMILILAAHAHYTIDVFLAFYISACLFRYYHILANNQAPSHTDRLKSRILFPFFYYFESNCMKLIPKEYEWPLPWPKSFKKSFENHNSRPRKKYI